MLELANEISPLVFCALLGVAFCAGFIDAIAGGGGLLTIPTLLMVGIPAHIALGTNKLAASFGSLTAALTFYKRGIFKPKLWGKAAAATFIGAILGTLCADQISAHSLNLILPMLIIFTAIYALVMPAHNGLDEQ